MSYSRVRPAGTGQDGIQRKSRETDDFKIEERTISNQDRIGSLMTVLGQVYNGKEPVATRCYQSIMARSAESWKSR